MFSLTLTLLVEDFKYVSFFYFILFCISNKASVPDKMLVFQGHYWHQYI